MTYTSQDLRPGGRNKRLSASGVAWPSTLKRINLPKAVNPRAGRHSAMRRIDDALMMDQEFLFKLDNPVVFLYVPRKLHWKRSMKNQATTMPSIISISFRSFNGRLWRGWNGSAVRLGYSV